MFRVTLTLKTELKIKYFQNISLPLKHNSMTLTWIQLEEK